MANSMPLNSKPILYKKKNYRDDLPYIAKKTKIGVGVWGWFIPFSEVPFIWKNCTPGQIAMMLFFFI